ncbi:Ca(2+)-dependent cysteine protease [Mortierella antarctica]|nr:Ca(2+)-dependent cysteine protease [Mortierella antarctica]
MYPGQQHYQYGAPQGYAPPQQSMYPPPGQGQYQQQTYQHYEQHTYQYQHQSQYPPQHFQQSLYNIPQHMMSPETVPPPPAGWAVRRMVRDAPPVSNFQLSTCQGRKRALFVGINYFNQSAELRGCINDVKNIKQFVIERFGFREEDSITLTDDQQDPSRVPTRSNILAAMQWLVKGAQPNDSFFFHFSGHGGQKADEDGDEEDGNDETIYPVDHEQAGFITDDVMHDLMVRPLPAGCRLTAIMDCCHSGSALDLPYIYSTTGDIKEASVLADVGSGVFSAGVAYLRGDKKAVMRGLMDMGKKIISRKNVDREKKEKKASEADCIMFSGCKDTQTSADAMEQGNATGALSFAVIAALRDRPQQTYLELLNSIRDILRAKYSQKPQLSASHPVDLSLQFTM